MNMKFTHLFTIMTILAIMYSCGNGGNASKELNADSLTTTNEQLGNNQAQKQEKASMTEQEKAELYKYFSKEEIQKGMDNAKNILCVVDEEIGSVDILAYDELLKKEGFAMSPAELENKWGKAKSEEINKSKEEVDGELYETTSAYMVFPHFELLVADCGKDCWRISSLSTETSGFGFGGIYVGIPECNKTYLLKLFEKFEVKENEFNGNKVLSITLNSDFYRGLSITLDKNELVKSLSYSASSGL